MFLQLLAFRLVNALVLNTYFSADEYYQSVEVAHCQVFGGDQCELTWEWQPEHALRGYLHPLIFTLLFYVMRLCNVTNHALYVIAPRLLQALSSAICDYTIVQLCKKWFPSCASISYYALLTTLSNWFNFYCGVRTFSNSLETTITAVAIYFYPYYPMSTLRHTPKESDSLRSDTLWLFFAGLGCVLRPTSAIIWLPLYLFQLVATLKRKSIASLFRFIAVGTLPYVAFWLLLSITLDSWMYGKFTVVVLNFLKFNVFENRSHFYGVQPWHWYFSQGFPVITFAHFPLFLVALLSFRWLRDPAYKAILLIIYVLLTYSLFAHKEFRFIYPILPVTLVYIAKVQADMLPSRKAFKSAIVVSLIALQVAMAIYFSQVHQRGTIAATKALSEKIPKVKSVYYLVPCHHAPSYSHLFNYKEMKRINLRHLDCSPCFGNCTTYEEEQAVFYRDPEAFLRTEFTKLMQNGEELPSHLVMYSDLIPSLHRIFQEFHFAESDRLFHMHMPHVHDKRMSEHVVIFERQ